jgi:hypothetical protein
MAAALAEANLTCCATFQTRDDVWVGCCLIKEMLRCSDTNTTNHTNSTPNVNETFDLHLHLWKTKLDKATTTAYRLQLPPLSNRRHCPPPRLVFKLSAAAAAVVVVVVVLEEDSAVLLAATTMDTLHLWVVSHNLRVVVSTLCTVWLVVQLYRLLTAPSCTVY